MRSMRRNGRYRRPWLAARVALVTSVALVGHPAGAWSNHALGTWPALAPMPELQRRALR